tara:strand:- start:106 stop:348 length:243 start_codon:yes stop_codon:yes gene_type:complete
MKTLIYIFWDLLVGKGVRKTSEKTFNKRIKTCRSNECGVYKKPLGMEILEKCGACGCFLKLKARMNEPYIKCPKGLWNGK